MKILFDESFYRDLKQNLPKKICGKILIIIDEMEKAKELKEISNIKKLSGFKSYYRISIGDYRIGIESKKNEVNFIRILHRKEIYRFFP
jgi:mRNA interferase RelE/StbE